MHYEFTSRVRYSEIAPDGAMTLPAIVSRMQDCSVFHSDAVGRGPAFWLTDERGWIIVSWQIVFRGTPHFGEALTTRTWGTCTSWRGRKTCPWRSGRCAATGPAA